MLYNMFPHFPSITFVRQSEAIGTPVLKRGTHHVEEHMPSLSILGLLSL